MPKRSFDSREREVTERNIKAQEAIIAYNSFHKAYFQLELDIGLGVQFAKAYNDTKAKLEANKDIPLPEARYEYAHAKLMLEVGLMQNMEEKRRKYIENIKTAEAEIAQAEFVIATAKEQLANGVEIKEIVKEEINNG